MGNGGVDQAIASFEHFTEMYQVADDQDATKVWKLEKVREPPCEDQEKIWNLSVQGLVHDLCRDIDGLQDDVRPVLRAFFHLARLRGRMNLFGTM